MKGVITMKNWLVNIARKPLGATRWTVLEEHYFSDGVQAWEFFYDTVRDYQIVHRKGSSLVYISKDMSDGFNTDWVIHGSELFNY